MEISRGQALFTKSITFRSPFHRNLSPKDVVFLCPHTSFHASRDSELHTRPLENNKAPRHKLPALRFQQHGRPFPLVRLRPNEFQKAPNDWLMIRQFASRLAVISMFPMVADGIARPSKPFHVATKFFKVCGGKEFRRILRRMAKRFQQALCYEDRDFVW